MALPVLARRRYPFGALLACSALLLIYYTAGIRRNISPAPLLSLPLYDAAVAGFLAAAIVIPTVYMLIGLIVVELATRESYAVLASDFLLPAVVMALAIMLGDAVRSRRALAAETADRLRLAEEENAAEAARLLAEERLRIARELHDTVAHSIATITVQAGSALHLLAGRGGAHDVPGAVGPDGAAMPDSAAGPQVREALAAIRETGKAVLADIRVTLGQLRGGQGPGDGPRRAGLDRLDALADAVRAAGAPVCVTVEGSRCPLPPAVDHAAYRILQESLTNVLRHAGPRASAQIRLCYGPAALTIRVTDDGPAPSAGGTVPPGDGTAPPGDGAGRAGGHGLTGMAERAAAVGGRVSAGRRDGGGFGVLAELPLAGRPGGRPARVTGQGR